MSLTQRHIPSHDSLYPMMAQCGGRMGSPTLTQLRIALKDHSSSRVPEAEAAIWSASQLYLCFRHIPSSFPFLMC